MLELWSSVPPILEVNHTTSPSAIWQVLPKMLPYSPSLVIPINIWTVISRGSCFLREPYHELPWQCWSPQVLSGSQLPTRLWPLGGSCSKHRTSKTVGPWKILVPLGPVSPGASPTDTAQYTLLCTCLHLLPPCKATHWKLGKRNIHATGTSSYWKQRSAHMGCHGNRTVIIMMVVATGIYKDKYCSICLNGLTH